jgi:transitional endoplasmic reticulum ATPase
MAESAGEGLRFKVTEALSKDVGRGFARLDPEDLARLHASTGDVLEVRGQRTKPTAGR